MRQCSSSRHSVALIIRIGQFEEGERGKGKEEIFLPLPPLPPLPKFPQHENFSDILYKYCTANAKAYSLDSHWGKSASI